MSPKTNEDESRSAEAIAKLALVQAKNRLGVRKFPEKYLLLVFGLGLAIAWDLFLVTQIGCTGFGLFRRAFSKALPLCGWDALYKILPELAGLIFSWRKYRKLKQLDRELGI